MDWSTLEHALGRADDLPALFADLASGDRRALGNLAQRLAHQGWASCAAATAAVPELARIAAAVADVRAPVALLLADLACLGDHLHFLAGGFGRDTAADGLLQEPGYRGLRAAVRSEAAIALDWVRNEDPVLRSAAAVLLAVAQPDGAMQELQRAAAEERSRTPRSDMQAALGWFEGADRALLRKGLKRKTPDRFGAAIALAMHDRLEPAVVEALVAPGPLRRSAWNAGDIAGHGLKVLIAACGRAGDATPLYDALATMEGIHRTKAAAQLLKIEFAEAIRNHRYDAPRRATPALDSLSVGQRRLLAELCRYESGWGRSDQTYWLTYLGFWPNPVETRRYLGLPARQTMLDRSRTGETWGEYLLPRLDAEEPAVSARDAADRLTPSDAIALAEAVPRAGGVNRLAARRFRLHLLVAQGDPAALRSRMSELIERGRWMTFWAPNWNGLHSFVDASLEDDLFIALRRLDPSAERPPGLRVDRTARERLLADADEAYGPEIASWIRAALSPS